ncbi:unnamed protein product, partial [Symbiodinium necroappetens]
APSWLVSAVPVVAGTDGNRHERKKWRKASAVAVHLFCGRDRATWKSSAEVAHVVTVDQAEDVMADATYAALLDLALTGKIKTVFGGRPRPLRDREGSGRWGREGLCDWETWRVRQDTIMIFRMLFLWMAAAAVARANGDRDPDFILEHPEDPREFLKGENMASLWAFPEIQFLKDEMKWFWWGFDQGPLGHPRRKPTRILASMTCPRELWKVRGPSSVTEDERDHDGDGFRSATWAAWAPGLKQAVKRVVEESLAGSTLEKVMKLDQAFLDHLRRDHTPFRRDCKACLAGSFRGHAHRRIVAPEAWCLSLDVIGPTRQGVDEYLKKIRYALIGTLVVPDMLGKLLQPPDDGADEGGGVGPLDDDDPICEEGPAEDGDDEAPAVEEERSRRELERWKARVEKDKLDGVSCVEVPFVVIMGSKTSAEVLAATKDILVQVKKLGLVFVKQRSWKLKKEEFVEKVVAAKILCPSMDVARGFLVRTEEGSYLTTMAAVENVKETSGEFVVDAPPVRADESGVRRRLRGKVAIAKAELAVDEQALRCEQLEDEHLIQDEELAALFLEAGDYSMSAVEELLESLWLKEHLVPGRRPEVFDGAPQVSVHVLGMFRHGGVVGATTLARTRPFLTRFLVAAVKEHSGPDTTFTTRPLNFNTPMQCHKDGNNKAGETATLIGFGNYVGGALWCHTPVSDVRESMSWHKVNGKWLPGHRYATYHKAVVFDPCQLHQPLPWQGNRITMTAYTVGCPDNCNQPHRDLLQELGFPLPPPGVPAFSSEGGGIGGECGKGEGDHDAVCCMSGCQGPGENLNSESRDGVAGGGPFSNGCQGPGENLKSESRDGVAGGGHCKCKGWEVDPSLCLCRLPGEETGGGAAQFYIGDDENEECSEDPWFQESWGAFGPPMVATLKPASSEAEVSYEIVASEAPLEVGWDLFEGYLDEVRCLLVEEENWERALAEDQDHGSLAACQVKRWNASREDLESEMELWQKYEGSEEDKVCVAELVEGGDEAPLHTKTIPNEVVRKELDRWVPSMLSEYESLIRENEAVEPFPEEKLEQWKQEGKDFDLVPGKTVHTVKAFMGRLKTRAVICGNFLGQSFSKDQKYAAGADGVLTRIALMGGVCQETIWRVKRALYGMVTSPRSWEVYRNKTMAQMKGATSEGEVRFVPSEIDGSLWYIQVGGRRAGAILCYVDDLLIAGEPEVAKEAARVIASTWKCTEPQWDNVHKDLEGYEEVPAPTVLTSEDFDLIEEESAADFVRPEILYAVNLLSQAISKRPKEAVYRGGHLIKYLKRYPEGGRSQQAIMVFVLGGLVAWTSSRQAFVTMSTAESELVAICELTTCVKSVEQLVAEIMLSSKDRASEVIKAICSDSQAALAVCANTVNATQAKKLIVLLCLASVVERGEAAEIETQEPFDYLFLGVCLVAVIAIWESLKVVLDYIKQCCRSTGVSRGVEELDRSIRPGAVDPVSSDSLRDSSLETAGLRVRTSRLTGERRPPTPPIPEPLHDDWFPTTTNDFVMPSGKRDYWEIDERRGVAIRYHPTARLNLFVPGQAAGGPPLNRFTGERRTLGRLSSGQVLVHVDDFTRLSKPAQLLANKEWRGRTELRLKKT